MMETGKLCQVESGYNRHLEAGKCSQYWTNKKSNEHDAFSELPNTLVIAMRYVIGEPVNTQEGACCFR